jgi:hypothetical protein
VGDLKKLTRLPLVRSARMTIRLRLGKSRVDVDQREPPLSTLSTCEIVMNPKHSIAVAIIGLLMIVGCEEPAVRVRSLPVPAAEQPASNLPVSLHQRNWTGSLGQGSCVHASLVNHLRWLNEFELGERWRTTYSDGEWDSRLRDRLDAAGIDYSYTIKADPRFLDWASNTRRGAILWWKPSHCCTFVGWVNRDGKQYAGILDNNYPGRFELTPREQFVRLWAGYGGFALTVLNDPSSSLPYRSYEVIQ